MLFDIARDLMVSLSALVASILAFLGLNAWRRQLRGTTEYQIALKTLKAIYALRESITEARGRFEAAPHPGEAQNGTSAESEVLRAARSYRLRLTRVSECRADLLRTEQEALAAWGEQARDALTGLVLAVDELFTTCDLYFDDEVTRARKKDSEGKDLGPGANDVAMYHTLYSGQDHDKDPFAKRIARSGSQAEEFYRAKLK